MFCIPRQEGFVRRQDNWDNGRSRAIASTGLLEEPVDLFLKLVRIFGRGYLFSPPPISSPKLGV